MTECRCRGHAHNALADRYPAPNGHCLQCPCTVEPGRVCSRCGSPAEPPAWTSCGRVFGAASGRGLSSEKPETYESSADIHSPETSGRVLTPLAFTCPTCAAPPLCVCRVTTTRAPARAMHVSRRRRAVTTPARKAVEPDPLRGHNHLTRDIKDRGWCPACDYWWERSEEASND